MGRSNRPLRRRQGHRPVLSSEVPATQERPVSLGVVIAIGVVLFSLPVLLTNVQQTGDPLQVRRELRKF